MGNLSVSGTSHHHGIAGDYSIPHFYHLNQPTIKMTDKLVLFCYALITSCLVALCVSCSKSDPAPVSTDPQLTSVDKTSVINGEIITITGKNFSKNYQGNSQIIATNVADNTKQVYLFILSRTETQIVAVMTGTDGGSVGTYKLSYNSRPTSDPAKLYTSTLSVDITAAGAKFFTGSQFISNNVTAGNTASFNVKNGSTTAGDYTVKLVGYNYETGLSTENNATVTGIVAGGAGAMDQLNFTVPNITAGTYSVKVTYTTNTLVAGWGTVFNVN